MAEDKIIWKENRYGVEKPHVQVDIGTTVLEVPKRLRNPITERLHDLTNLSDDGYLKPFIAHMYAADSPNVVNLGSAPVLTFDKDRWELEEHEGQYVIVKRDAETTFGEMVLETADND